LNSRKPARRRSPAVEQQDGTLTDRAYRELEEMIVTLRLLPGTVLSEQALSVRLKIGRTPIREALQRLARDGLVVIMPRRGIMVSEINLRLQLRLLEVRRELERLMASLAAERATTEERREFAELAEAMLAAAANADDIAFMRLDQRFNILIATAARNEFARRSMGLMNALFTPLLVSALPASRGPAACRQIARRGSGRGVAEESEGSRDRIGPPDRLHRGFRTKRSMPDAHQSKVMTLRMVSAAL
jgi:DNA-binding GntR family transcriptional regulator